MCAVGTLKCTVLVTVLFWCLKIKDLFSFSLAYSFLSYLSCKFEYLDKYVLVFIPLRMCKHIYVYIWVYIVVCGCLSVSVYVCVHMQWSAGVCEVGVSGPVRDSCKGCGLLRLWSLCSHKGFISALSNPPQPTDRWALGLVSELFPLPLSFFVSFLFIKPPAQTDCSDQRGGSICGDPAVMGNRWAGVSIIWHFLSGKSTGSACHHHCPVVTLYGTQMI